MYRSIFLACVAFAATFPLSAQHIADHKIKAAKEARASKDDELVWLDWNEGYEKAVRTKKIVLVDAYTDWCGWCKKMDRDTYTNAEVIKKINKYFVPVKFNPEQTDKTYVIGDQKMTSQELYSQLSRGEATGFPTIYYIYPGTKRVFIDPGYKDPETFLHVLNMAIEDGKK